MKKYDITTKVVREIYTDYFIEANSEEEAIEIYKSGKSLGSETTEDMSEEEIVDINAYDIKKEKVFVALLSKAEKDNDWSLVRDVLTEENKPNESSITVQEMPLSNIAIQYISEIANDRVMEDISYEDFLTEDEAEAYRIALQI